MVYSNDGRLDDLICDYGDYDYSDEDYVDYDDLVFEDTIDEDRPTVEEEE